MKPEPVRLSKLMSERGLCSRREADEYIRAGQVLVDGKVVDVLGSKVLPDQAIELKAKAQSKQQNRRTILIHKPIGLVSGLAEKDYQSAITLFTQQNRYIKTEHASKDRRGFAPAGRLDIDSTGLLVFTQDGRIAKSIIGENSPVEKEYLVRVTGAITNDKIKRLRHGLSLDNQALKPAKVQELKPGLLQMILIQGKHRQIRRMCALIELKVIQLHRVRIGNVKLGALPRGKWRYLKHNETF